MMESDIGFAVDLIRAERWGHTRIDLARMLSLSPGGSYVWEDCRKPCGFITSMRYERTAMIGHLLVSSDSRGRQVGKGLVAALLEDVDASGVRSTMLYATEEGSRLYRQFGFEDSGYELIAVGILLKDSERRALRTTCSNAREGDVAEIAARDRMAFGDDRSELMARLLLEFPEHCFKLERSGHLAGYVLGRRTPIGFDIGPWYCDTGRWEDGAALLDSVLSSFPCGGRIDISPFASNRLVPRIIARHHKYRRAERVKLMIRGDMRYSSGSDDVLGVAGFELG